MKKETKKAQEIYSRFFLLGIGYIKAITCALIAVDEILGTYDDTNNEDYKLISYWQQVKQEIERL